MDKPTTLSRIGRALMRKEIAISGSDIYSTTDFHNYISQVLNFPSYYRHDIDDLYDCLCHYIDPNLTINWINHRDSQRNLGHEFERIIEVFGRIEDIHKSFKILLN
jgi:RNAse (barnase) inhibitor barstar